MSIIPDPEDERRRLHAVLERHPDLDDAIRGYTSAILRLRERIGFASKILSKEERYRAFTIFALLAFGRGDAEGGEGMLSGTFSSYCTTYAGISKRTAQSTLQLLVLYRFATASVDPLDRRGRRYAPTPMLRTYMEDWLDASLVALRRLGSWPAVQETSRDRLAGYFRQSGDAYARNSYMFFPDPDFRHVFADLEGGSLVVMAAIEAAGRGGVGPSRGELRTRFRLSRAQATRIVAEGRERALFGADGNGATTVLPRLRELYRDCILRVLSFLLLHYERDHLEQARRLDPVR